MVWTLIFVVIGANFVCEAKWAQGEIDTLEVSKIFMFKIWHNQSFSACMYLHPKSLINAN